MNSKNRKTMKYEDIQIGNYVKCYAENGWHLHKVNRKAFSQENKIENMIPILITPELLKILGFRVENDICSFYGKSYNVAGMICTDTISYNFLNSTLKIFHIIVGVDLNEFDGSVKYLHQLQQLMKVCGCKPFEIDEDELENYINK